MSKLLKKNKTQSKTTNKKIYLHYFEPKVKIEGFEFVNIEKLEKLKNNTYEEIVIQDVLEYYSDSDAVIVLKEIANKLQANGKLHIQGLDSKALCYGIVYSQIDITSFKTFVFGIGKNNIYTIGQVKNFINNEISSILKINKVKFLNGLQYYIECIKA